MVDYKTRSLAIGGQKGHNEAEAAADDGVGNKSRETVNSNSTHMRGTVKRRQNSAMVRFHRGKDNPAQVRKLLCREDR